MIAFNRVASDDFESAAPIRRFSLGAGGAVVVCQHTDDVETWLPIDMWLPGGFTPME